MQDQKIRIKLKSYWVDLLQHSVDMIKDAAENTGATIAGPVPLPTRCAGHGLAHCTHCKASPLLKPSYDFL